MELQARNYGFHSTSKVSELEFSYCLSRFIELILTEVCIYWIEKN